MKLDCEMRRPLGTDVRASPRDHGCPIKRRKYDNSKWRRRWKGRVMLSSFEGSYLKLDRGTQIYHTSEKEPMGWLCKCAFHFHRYCRGLQ